MIHPALTAVLATMAALALILAAWHATRRRPVPALLALTAATATLGLAILTQEA